MGNTKEQKGTKNISMTQWLSDHGLLDNLVDRLDPYLDSEVSFILVIFYHYTC